MSVSSKPTWSIYCIPGQSELPCLKNKTAAKETHVQSRKPRVYSRLQMNGRLPITSLLWVGSEMSLTTHVLKAWIPAQFLEWDLPEVTGTLASGCDLSINEYILGFLEAEDTRQGKWGK